MIHKYDESELTSASTNSTWCPITVSTLGDYATCDTVSTKADKDYVDASIMEAKEYMDERIRGIENLLETITISGDPFLSINTNKIIYLMSFSINCNDHIKIMIRFSKICTTYINIK